jgi:hypothetical protein
MFKKQLWLCYTYLDCGKNALVMVFKTSSTSHKTIDAHNKTFEDEILDVSHGANFFSKT